ncbi:MAG: hypothetical protein HY291_14285 [Planctomycetes bacterium]|nr:hypothetical protein [Planctomycetota bacterium]
MLTEIDAAFFKDQGYLNLGRILDDARLSELRAIADAELAKPQARSATSGTCSRPRPAPAARRSSASRA